MIMRKRIDSVWSFLVCLGRARAAASLARQGMHDEARRLYSSEEKPCQ